MWAKLRLSFLLGLTCGLLWLSSAASLSCRHYDVLLHQLKQGAQKDYYHKFMQKSDLNLPYLKDSCKMPLNNCSVESFADVPQHIFIQNVIQKILYFKQKLKNIDWIVHNLEGFNSNLYCMLQRLTVTTPPYPAEGRREPPQPHPSFTEKSETCKTLAKYQCYMRSVVKELETWGSTPGERNKKTTTLSAILRGHRKRK